MSKQTLRLALITAAILFAAPSVLAESFAEVQVTADSVGKSAILTVKTSQDTTVQTFSIWLDSGDFRSYKTGNDWATSLNPAGILTFAAPSPLESGASVQFGMTADTGNFKINWNAFDANGALVGSGAIIADNPSETTPSDGGEQGGTSTDPQNTGAISDSTSFQILSPMCFADLYLV